MLENAPHPNPPHNNGEGTIAPSPRSGEGWDGGAPSPRSGEGWDGAPDTLLTPTEALAGEFVLPATEAGPAAITAVERLAFRVGPLGLLCVPEAGREVVPPPAASRLPYLPAWLTGVANVRGLLLPIVDLAAALGIERDERLRPYLLIMGAGEDALGLLVDGLPVPRSFETEERMNGIPPHPELLHGHVHGAYVRDGQVWLDVDVQGFFQTLGERIAA